MARLEKFKHLPGYEIISKGVLDFENEIDSEEACLVKIASFNLFENGILPAPTQESGNEIKLYQKLGSRYPNPHFQYLALMERLVKFETSLALLN